MSATSGPEVKVDSTEFIIGQRVHSVGDCRRIGTVKYGNWVCVDWDNGDGKHDGSVNGIRYFQANHEKSASFVLPQNLSTRITFLQALEIKYKTTSTEEEDETTKNANADFTCSSQLPQLRYFLFSTFAIWVWYNF